MSIAATSTVLIDNDTTRVTQWRFAPDAQTGWHRHEYNYVVVPTMDGRLRIDTADEQSVFADMKSAEPYYREALKGIPDVRFPPQLPDEYRPVVWMTCVQVPAEKRLPLMRAAHEAQIETRPFFHPLSALQPYGKYARACPNSIELSATGVNLPTSHSVDEKVVERVACVFHDVFA